MGQRIHFIAIGGAVMHQLAIFLHKQGNRVSGSDDVIFDPALSQLQANGILPEEFGWFPERITEELDAVILGMHAKKGNPELEEAVSIGVPVFSFPEFIYQKSRNKKRIVIAGSHGKTSITSMVMHVLKAANQDFDYLVGARIQGFDTMVRITEDAPLIILEGDEYLSSAIDPRSKFLHYHPDVAVISGIAWDHINVFPTFAEYLETFRLFIQSIWADGRLFYYGGDEHLPALTNDANCSRTPYQAFEWAEVNGCTKVEYDGVSYPVNIFGRHNMENLRAAVHVCEAVGIDTSSSLNFLGSFLGSAKRLEEVYRNEHIGLHIYRDFAHAPSKLKASTDALRSKYPGKHIAAIFELHTYSSLQTDFLEHYTNTMASADTKAIYLDEHALKIKNRPDIPDEIIIRSFGDDSIRIIRNTKDLEEFVNDQPEEDVVYAFMSSGNFGGFDVEGMMNVL